MSETRQAFVKLRRLWDQMTPEDRADFVQYEAGFALMGAGIGMYFGWAGAVFLLGVILWHAGKP